MALFAGGVALGGGGTSNSHIENPPKIYPIEKREKPWQDRARLLGEPQTLETLLMGSDGYMCQGLNSHYFHVIGDRKLNPIVGVYRAPL